MLREHRLCGTLQKYTVNLSVVQERNKFSLSANEVLLEFPQVGLHHSQS
jgi:hypothetical protein